MAEFVSEVFIAWKVKLSSVFMEGECQLVARQCSICPSHMTLLMDLLPVSSSPPPPNLPSSVTFSECLLFLLIFTYT